MQVYAAFSREKDVRFPARPFNEDCLFLNVWTANLPRRDALQPVMVWIHGGSNVMGEAVGGWNQGEAQAGLGVVVVAINYRLGALGFMAHPGLTAESPNRSSGNYGLLDQLEALRWVQRNIEAFGGDPARVTVFGESAGAINVLHLIASPLSTGLFQRAAVQSAAVGGMPRLDALERRGVELATAAGAGPTGENLASLRALSADAIVKAASSFSFGPVVDGWVVPDVTGRRFEQGFVQRVPLLIGSNALEASTLRDLLPPIERTAVAYRAWVTTTFGPAAGTVGSLYPASTDAAVEPALLMLITDVLGTCSARFAARSMAAAGAPAWRYYFSRVQPGGERLGAYHAMEIQYVFGSFDPLLPYDDTDRRLSNAMMRYWTRFAATGDPNAGDLPSWPAYATDTDRHLDLGSSIVAGHHLKAELCDIADAGFRTQWGPIPAAR
jgi:para-nitrobenzyl esterase